METESFRKTDRCLLGESGHEEETETVKGCRIVKATGS